MSNHDLHVKYRPASLEEVVGQDHVINSLKSLFKDKKHPHAYLFTGDSGCGKTTLSRLVAKEMSCDESNIIEVDAASRNGIEDVRELVSSLQYATFGKNPNKFIIFDECFAKGSQVLTAAGLKPIESIKIGDTVSNWTGDVRVSNIFTNKVELDRVVKLSLSNGKNIICSSDHLFFTTDGWIKAKHLNKQAIVFSEALSYNALLNSNGGLYEKLCNLWYGIFWKNTSESFTESMLRKMPQVAETATFTGKTKRVPIHLSSVWNYFHAANFYFHSKNLQQNLWKYFSSIEKIYSSFGGMEVVYEKGSGTFETEKSFSLEREREEFFRTNESSQSKSRSRGLGKSETNQNGKRNFAHLVWKKRWEWILEYASSFIGNCVGVESRKSKRLWFSSNLRKMEARISDKNRLLSTTRQKWFSTLLQIGHWLPRLTSFDRSRWLTASNESEYRERFKERAKTNGIRVDNVEIYQRGNNNESFRGVVEDTERNQGYVNFYDLEIEGHPSYYVEGCLVHNCHAFSKSAWQVFLKTIEEPPPHVYFAFCTTESDKVPETIKTRCHVYNLKSVDFDSLFELISAISDAEDIVIGKDNKAFKLIAQAAMGSPRKALTMLSKCRGCSSLEDVRLILEEPDEEGEVIELCRMLCGKTALEWKHVQRILKRLEGQNPESIRLIVLSYTSKVLMNARSEDEAMKLLAILEAFSQFFNSSEKFAPLLLALGSLVFQNDQ